jgi:hypothetical protein
MLIGPRMHGRWSRLLTECFYNVSAFHLVFPPSLIIRPLVKVIKLCGLQVDVEASGVESTSRGLVGDTVFAVLPSVKPVHAFATTIAFQMVSSLVIPRIVSLTYVYRSSLSNYGGIRRTSRS